MAAVAPVLFPEMQRRGASEGELVSLLAAAGAMTETIPPSLVLITIGSVTGVSIAALFTGGLLPGRRAGRSRWRWWSRWRSAATRTCRRAAAALGSRAGTLLVALPALILPFVIRTAVVDGIATATEVSTIGIVYAVIVGIVVYRQFDWRRLYPMLVETAALSGAILLIIGTATAMAWALTQSGFSRQLATRWQRARRRGRLHGGVDRWRSSCWAACWRACRRSCCSVRCCFRSRASWE